MFICYVAYGQISHQMENFALCIAALEGLVLADYGSSWQDSSVFFSFYVQCSHILLSLYLICCRFNPESSGYVS